MLSVSVGIPYRGILLGEVGANSPIMTPVTIHTHTNVLGRGIGKETSYKEKICVPNST